MHTLVIHFNFAIHPNLYAWCLSEYDLHHGPSSPYLAVSVIQTL